MREVVHVREEVDEGVLGETKGEYHLGDARAGVPTRSKWQHRKRWRLGEVGLGGMRTSRRGVSKRRKFGL